MIKYFITHYKKINIYGDGLLERDGIIYPFVGQSIMVKLFGILWIEYRGYRVPPTYF